MADPKYQPQVVPNVDPAIRSWLDTEHRRIALAYNAHTHETADVTDLLSGDHVWTGLSTFSAEALFTREYSNPNTVAIELVSSLPVLQWNETDASADSRIWRAFASGEQFVISARNDADSAGTNWLTVDRTGTTVDQITFAAPTLFTGNNVQLDGTAPRYIWNDTDADTDEKGWLIGAFGPNLDFYMTDDDNVNSTTNGTRFLRVIRTGKTASRFQLHQDNLLLGLGASLGDFDLYHDGSDNRIDSGTGNLIIDIDSGGFFIQEAGVNHFQMDMGTTSRLTIGDPAVTTTEVAVWLDGDGNSVADVSYAKEGLRKFILRCAGDEDFEIFCRNDTDSGTNALHLIERATGNVIIGSIGTSSLQVSGNVGFNGATPAAPPTWTTSNVTTDRSINANGTLAEIGDGLTTLIEDLKAIGILQ